MNEYKTTSEKLAAALEGKDDAEVKAILEWLAKGGSGVQPADGDGSTIIITRPH